jgi:hypothetical protein
VTKRYLRFYDLRVKAAARYHVNGKPISNTVTAFTLLTILRQAKALFDASKLTHREIPDSVKYYLADIEIDENAQKATLLINKSDPTEPDQTISNPVSGERQELLKPDGFGNDYSAHLCVSLVAHQPNLYSMVYESPRGGIPGTQIHSFLNHLLRECRSGNKAEYKVPHPAGVMEGGAPLMVNALHSIELNGKISDEFLNDLANGTLGRIELANYENHGQVWDNGAGLSEEKKIIVLRPQIENLPPQGVIDALKQAFNRGNQFDYNEAVIRFRDPSDEAHTVKVNTDDFTLTDNERYVKKASIDTPDTNSNGYGEIDDDIKRSLYNAL